MRKMVQKGAVLASVLLRLSYKINGLHAVTKRYFRLKSR
jgi:hypothetical protein